MNFKILAFLLFVLVMTQKVNSLRFYQIVKNANCRKQCAQNDRARADADKVNRRSRNTIEILLSHETIYCSYLNKKFNKRIVFCNHNSVSITKVQG